MTASLATRLRRHVERLAGEIGERHVLRPAALQAAERYVGEALHALGFDVNRQNYEAQGVDCANLEVVIEGGTRATEIVLAGAHYDTVPGSPGADNNASGVAAVLELARLLRDAKPARTLRLVAFVSNVRSRRALRSVVDAFRAASDFPAQKLAAPALVPGIGWSDQLSFWREGYPAAMVTDTAFHRYRHYHQPTDTPEKLDYARMASVVDGLAGALQALAMER